MIRHIFIATIKDGVADEQVNNVMNQMQTKLQAEPVVKCIHVGHSLGLVGPTNTVTMVIDLDSADDFKQLLATDAHKSLSVSAGEVFRTDNFVFSQINI
jgi:hypothetical protein